MVASFCMLLCACALGCTAMCSAAAGPGCLPKEILDENEDASLNMLQHSSKDLISAKKLGTMKPKKENANQNDEREPLLDHMTIEDLMSSMQKDVVQAPSNALLGSSVDSELLFCFAVIMPKSSGSAEWQLVSEAYKKKRGLFEEGGCDRTEIYSDEEFEFAPGAKTIVPQVRKANGRAFNMTVSYDLCYDHGCASNTPVFDYVMAFIAESKAPEHFKWFAKLDADTTFFPQRLRGLLETDFAHAEAGIHWLYSCPQYHYCWMMGAIETFTASAMKVWEPGLMLEHGCSKYDDRFNQEDWFIWGCMHKYGGSTLTAIDEMMNTTTTLKYLVREDSCPLTRSEDQPGYVDCNNNDAVAYHPKKNLAEWNDCWEASATYDSEH